VPGDVITAVILGAFMIHGLRPGPILFQQNLDLIYALFMGIMMSSVFLFIVGKSSIRLFSRIAEIPNNILYPAVLVLCVYGAYAINNTAFDILVMMLTGILGFGMLRSGFPVAPFLIAFVLGPLLEDNFRQALLISHGGYEIFVRGPICWFFWVLTFLSLAMIIERNTGFLSFLKRQPGSGS
jgi:putative tricarboxylic transport membrane protein